MIAKFYEKLSKRERTLFFGCGAAIFLLLMDSLVLGPILTKLKILDAEIQAKSDTIRRNFRVLSFRESIVKEAKDYSAYFDSGQKTQEETLSDILREIENMASRNSVTISSIRPGDLADSPLSKIYSTTLECEGALKGVLQFMRDLEQSTYLFQVKAYQFAPKTKTGEIIKCSMAIAKNIIIADQTGG